MEIAALILSCIALVVAIYCIIQVEADRRSTHNIQYMPIEDVIKGVEVEPTPPPVSDIDKPTRKERKSLKFMNFLPEDELDV